MDDDLRTLPRSETKYGEMLADECRNCGDSPTVAQGYCEACHLFVENLETGEL